MTTKEQKLRLLSQVDKVIKKAPSDGHMPRFVESDGLKALRSELEADKEDVRMGRKIIGLMTFADRSRKIEAISDYERHEWIKSNPAFISFMLATTVYRILNIKHSLKRFKAKVEKTPAR